MYCYGAKSQSQNQRTLQTRNTFNAIAPAPTNSANMMRATKVDSEPPQARNAALIVKRAQCIPLHPPLWKETYTIETSTDNEHKIKNIEASDNCTLSCKFKEDKTSSSFLPSKYIGKFTCFFPSSSWRVEACRYLSKRLTHEHHEFGILKSNGSGGGIRTWIDIQIPLLTPCIVLARTLKVKTRVHSKPGTPSTRPPRHQLTPRI